MKRVVLLITAGLLTLNGVSQTTLSITECREMALEHNRTMKSAEKQADAAAAMKKAAFAQYFPNFSINGGYTYMNKEFKLLSNDLLLPVIPYTAIDAATGSVSQEAFANPAVASHTFVINPSTGSPVTDSEGNPVFQQYTWFPASSSTLGSQNIYVASGGFTQPLYMGGKIRQANRIAGCANDIAQEKVNLTKNELLYSTEEAYWRVISLGEKVRLAERYQEMLVHLVSDIENVRSEGIITDNDLLKARLKLSEAGLMKLRAGNGLELSKMALCQLIGIEYSSDIMLTDSLTAVVFKIPDVASDSLAIEDRPELGMLRKGEEIARAGEKMMLSRYLPNIAMSAGYTVSNPNPYNGFEKEFGGDMTVGVVCNIPLFHFGDRHNTMAAARNEREAAALQVEETREMLVLQFQQALFQYSESQKKSTIASEALDQSYANLMYTQNNFREGILKTTDVLEAQVLWQKAYSEYIDSLTEQQLSVCNLKRVTATY
ncbi:MAG: TolC family protein [Bacteroidales bacterium]|jgi:outer membrane protein TolC|nr:TolC family protein [Bacteroidales bacterium]